MIRNYLDYAGLKRVIGKLFGIRRIWHGTLEEWEALTPAERDYYDQAEVIDDAGITEDKYGLAGNYGLLVPITFKQGIGAVVDTCISSIPRAFYDISFTDVQIYIPNTGWVNKPASDLRISSAGPFYFVYCPNEWLTQADGTTGSLQCRINITVKEL